MAYHQLLTLGMLAMSFHMMLLVRPEKQKCTAEQDPPPVFDVLHPRPKEDGWFFQKKMIELKECRHSTGTPTAREATDDDIAWRPYLDALLFREHFDLENVPVLEGTGSGSRCYLAAKGAKGKVHPPLLDDDHIGCIANVELVAETCKDWLDLEKYLSKFRKCQCGEKTKQLQGENYHPWDRRETTYKDHFVDMADECMKACVLDREEGGTEDTAVCQPALSRLCQGSRVTVVYQGKGYKGILKVLPADNVAHPDKYSVQCDVDEPGQLTHVTHYAIASIG